VGGAREICHAEQLLSAVDDRITLNTSLNTNKPKFSVTTGRSR
jgi:hypothetical protein